MSNLTHVEYVNLNGETVRIDAKNPSWKPPKKKGAAEQKSFHKGWRVVGINEEMASEAKAKRDREITEAIATNANPLYASRPAKVPPPFDRDDYLKNGKMMPIHKKPFAIESSAKTCVDLALKNGWIVAVAVEMKKVVAS